MQYADFEPNPAKAQDTVVSKQTDGQTKHFMEQSEMPRVCVPTRNVFENNGCIKEGRAKQKEQAKEEATAKQGPSETAQNQRTDSKTEHKRWRKLVKSTKGNTPIVQRDFLSIQPSVTAMRRGTFNTLGKLTIPRADSSVITRLLVPHGQRQNRDRETEGDITYKPIASRNEPTAEQVSRGSIATLKPGAWINSMVITYVGRVLIAPQQT
jgi:hypothetical protein